MEPEKQIRFALRIRIPRWAESYEISLNGKPVSAREAEGGIEISRSWKTGDEVQLSLPMKYRWVKGVQFYEGRSALMHGPQVFCVSRDQNPLLEDIPLSSITFDPASVAAVEPAGSTALRNGQAARVSGQTPDGKRVEVIFTDFPEVNGEETYFHVSDPAYTHQDELYGMVQLEKYNEIED
jgi:hypothetical protein